ncbi:MAG: 3-dehydroquinate synthase [Deltaproteobacteria bacterium HGW-Deltaproteobacteria-14]|nr:MAG: 3-dehydroquinate synthase [Deltaproteobacteria bacterium HGW-Deltaproteobacteria-14]
MAVILDRVDVALGDRAYPILLVDALPGALAAQLVTERVPDAARALVVTDSNVGPLYAAEVVGELAAAGLVTAVLELPAGEASKHLETVSRVVDAALAHGLLRGDLLVALGGGVIGDITGFAAAIVHRGIAFVQLPTSLLAQVDSAVGGKTGVNHASGKNLIGAFWQPVAVVSSMPALQTLDPREVRCGLAEALKHALIADAALLETVLAGAEELRALAPTPTAALVGACCRIKAAVVAADERDRGQRALLNFGHTFGHAFELLLGYGALTHGEAVGLGMVLAARLSERLGVAPCGVEARVRGALAALGLPSDPDAAGLPALPALVAAARGDKKADAGGVRFVVLEAVGAAALRRLSWPEGARHLAPPPPEPG